MKRKVVSVSDVNRYVNHLLGEDYVLGDVWIAGEVSNCKYHHTGHIYFTLKDDLSSVNVVMFAKEANAMTFRLAEGMHVYVRARMSLYEKTGAFQGYVTEIEQQGIGTLYEAFERLKKQLSDEGLFDSHYKKDLPNYPKRVGVITSKTGAAIKDIIQVARRRNPSVLLYIYPVHVQGIHAKDEIIQAIKDANKQQLVDVLIVGRGGGSIEDLWAFNEESVARTIFQSKIPIVSAVGHEVDFTIADFVSDYRAATPSAAAEIVVPDQNQSFVLLANYKDRLQQGLKQTLYYQTQALKGILTRSVYTYKNKVIEDRQLTLVDQLDKLDGIYKQRLEHYRYQLMTNINKVDHLSPLKTLQRGYTLMTKESEEAPLSSVTAVNVGERVKVTLADGYIIGRIEEKG